MGFDKKRRAIGVGIDSRVGYFRNLLGALAKCVRQWNVPVVYLHIHDKGKQIEEKLKRCAGFIGALAFERQAELVLAQKIPMVNVSSRWEHKGVSRAVIDDVAVGRMAAEHLLTRRCRTYGYVRIDGVSFDEVRLEGFRRTIEKAGHEVKVCPSPQGFNSKWAVGEWLRDLEKPMGIMAANDQRAFRFLDMCGRLGIGVPEEVGVVGVDNELPLCDICEPALSSVMPNVELQAEEAVRLLMGMVEGREKGGAVIAVPPLTVVSRASTNFVGTTDAEMVAATGFILQNMHRGIGVEDLAEAMSTSRRTLERKFEALLGRTPGAEIRRVKMERARELLADRSLGVQQVAKSLGYVSERQFSLAYKEFYGETPKQFQEGTRREIGR